MKFNTPLNTKGFGHVEFVVAILFVAIFGFVGYRVVASHAQVPPDLSASYLTCSFTASPAKPVIGKSFSVTYTIKNKGTTVANSGVGLTLNAWLDTTKSHATNIAWATTLKTANISAVTAAGATVRGTISGVIPAKVSGFPTKTVNINEGTFNPRGTIGSATSCNPQWKI